MPDGISSTSLDFHGNHGIILEDPGTLKISRTGMATCTAVFKIVKSKYLQLKAIGSRHPIFDFLTLDSSEIALLGAWAVQTCNYAGVQAQYDDASPTYELVVGVSDEPIDTHKKFKTFAGTPRAPLNGAIFEDEDTGIKVFDGAPVAAATDKGYRFLRFAIYTANGTLNTFAKIENYLEAAQVTWKRTTTRKISATSIAAVGFIGNPKGPAPTLPTGRNWLYMGITQSQKGQVFQVTEEWRASGRRGWNGDIYTA